MYLFELGTRPHEAKTEEERKRIEKYEAIVRAVMHRTEAAEAERELRRL